MRQAQRVVLHYAKEDDDCVLKAARKYLKGVDKDWGYILPEELNKLLKKTKKDEYYIIDLRDANSYKKGHIPGAVNIYWEDILDPENLKNIPEDKKIFLVCYLGHTSSQVLVLLKMLGYSNVVSMKFGMGKPPKEGVKVAGWLDLDYDIEK